MACSQKLQKMGSNETVQTQVLPTWPVLRHCLLVPYVLLPMLGNASVPVLNGSFTSLLSIFYVCALLILIPLSILLSCRPIIFQGQPTFLVQRFQCMERLFHILFHQFFLQRILFSIKIMIFRIGIIQFLNL